MDNTCGFVNDEWRRWIAENLMLGSQSGDVLRMMIERNILPGEAEREINAALTSPYLLGAKRLKNRLAKLGWLLDIQRKLNRQLPLELERRHKLKRDIFLREYYTANRPVVITGMMDMWPAMEKWTLDYFREEYGEREVEVQFGRNSDAYYELNSVAHRRTMKFRQFVTLVETAGRTNDFYMTANNGSQNRLSLDGLWRDIPQMPEYLDPLSTDQGFLWFGPAGTVTPLHHDLTNNFMAQVIGRKRVLIVPACEVANMYNHVHCYTPVDGTKVDYQRYPRMQNVQMLHFILKPGEILFLPVGCWHLVEGMDITVTVSFINFLWDNDFSSNFPNGLEY
jgi:hypothetical protein